jgi:hypothetical protein
MRGRGVSHGLGFSRIEETLLIEKTRGETFPCVTASRTVLAHVLMEPSMADSHHTCLYYKRYLAWRPQYLRCREKASRVNGQVFCSSDAVCRPHRPAWNRRMPYCGAQVRQEDERQLCTDHARADV